WLRILCCLLLLGAQTLLTLEGAASARDKAACVCPGCTPVSCCACNRAPTPQPAPATPARTVAAMDLSWLATAASQLLDPPLSSSNESAASPSAFRLVGRVLIFQRDCAYLI